MAQSNIDFSSVSTVGLDLAKHVFHVHGADSAGRVVVSKRLRRKDVAGFFARLEPCLVGLEACASSHHWARLLTQLGHEVRLIPPSYVKAYVRRQKNDAADAAAICEAVTRPGMRFVPVKTVEQQSVLMLHRARNLLVGQRTALINALRGHLYEFGFVAAQGAKPLAELMALVTNEDEDCLPVLARRALVSLIHQIASLERDIAALDRQILEWHRNNAASRRLATIPGIGPLTASAIVASITDPSMFRSGRELAAFLGLVPRQTSSGGKEKLGRISKMGDRYLRTLLVAGATAVLRHARKDGSSSKVWAEALLDRKPFKVVAVALANKSARIAWALLTRGETFDGVRALAA